MKRIYTVLAALVAGFGMSVSAEEYENVFNPHWYVQGQVGGQYTLGELGFSDLLSPNAQLGVGRNFTPVVGARLSVNAWQSKAGSDFFATDYSWKWNYVAPSLDATINLSNWFGGYNPDRKVSFGVLAGIGANIAFNNDEAVDASKSMLAQYANVSSDDQFLRYLWEDNKVLLNGRVGATVDYKISEKVTAGLELQANAVGDRYNSKKAGNPDWYFNALVGVKINLGKTNTKKVIPAPAPVDCGERIVEKEVIKEVPVEKTVVEPLRVDVFFQINKSKIQNSEEYKVEQIAEYLNKYPNAKVEISSYADKNTGNAKINQKLSEQRAESVAKQLQEKYGIEASRISTSALGDTEQPYTSDYKLNRVSICIAK